MANQLAVAAVIKDKLKRDGDHHSWGTPAGRREFTEFGSVECEHSTCNQEQPQLQVACCFQPSGYPDLCSLENKWLSPNCVIQSG